MINKHYDIENNTNYCYHRESFINTTRKCLFKSVDTVCDSTGENITYNTFRNLNKEPLGYTKKVGLAVLIQWSIRSKVIEGSRITITPPEWKKKESTLKLTDEKIITTMLLTKNNYVYNAVCSCNWGETYILYMT